jgi:hypothetical protein
MKSQYKKGTENLPLPRIVTSLKAYVVVFNLQDNDEVVLEKEIDYGNFEDRKWLGRITHWAMTNHHSVETMALVDAQPPTLENK